MSATLEYCVVFGAAMAVLYAVAKRVGDRGPGRISNTASTLLFILGALSGFGFGSLHGVRGWLTETLHVSDPAAVGIVTLVTGITFIELRVLIVSLFPHKPGDAGGQPN